MFGTTMGLAVPNFWLAMVLILIFAVNLKWFPAIGYTPFADDPRKWIESITLPAVALSIALSASLARQVRGALADVMASNYVKTAWAVGAGLRRVVGKHAFKNASIPAITVIGFALAGLLGGAVLVEQIFAIPGMGNYVLSAILANDLPVIQGVALLFVLVNVTMSLLVDIAYGIVNPKVRVS
jgi:peptide/nickel transport system permease protein